MKIGDILPNKEINFPASSRCHVPVWIHNSSRPGESGENHAVMRVARKSSSHAASFRLRRKESLPVALRMRLGPYALGW
jgi:hypothetical protein